MFPMIYARVLKRGRRVQSPADKSPHAPQPTVIFRRNGLDITDSAIDSFRNNPLTSHHLPSQLVKHLVSNVQIGRRDIPIWRIQS